MGYFPVPGDSFEDKVSKSVGDYLVVIFNWLWNWITGNLTTCTSGELHVYADGTSGDDLNDGLARRCRSRCRSRCALAGHQPPSACLTQVSTWAAIDAGTPVAVTAEMTMAKEVA